MTPLKHALGSTRIARENAVSGVCAVKAPQDRQTLLSPRPAFPAGRAGHAAGGNQ